MEWLVKEFSELTVHELYDALKLRVDVFVVEQGCPYHEIDGYDTKAVHILGVKEGVIVAYARLLPGGEKYEEPSIGRVIIHPSKRGTGLGHLLMEKAVAYMEENWRPMTMRLQAQSHLENFYGKHGFKAISEPYDDDGIPHVDMIRETPVKEASFY